MIYLSPVVYKVPGVDTWWEWFERNFNPTSQVLPVKYNQGDVVLRYSTKGPIDAFPGKSIALCWELLPELRRVFQTNRWDRVIETTFRTAKSCSRRLISTEFARKDYEPFGKVDILPIGVDTDLFKPFNNIEELCVKYEIPFDKEVGFWCGSMEPMKGYKNVLQYAKENPNIFWILVWYSERGTPIVNSKVFDRVPQSTLVELMNCADFQLSASLLKPYYMVEYEGMSCNLKQRKILGIQKDFEAGSNPRDRIFEKQWDRITCKKLYENYLNNL